MYDVQIILIEDIKNIKGEIIILRKELEKILNCYDILNIR